MTKSLTEAIRQHRLNFPALQNKHYMNFGAQGPLSSQALKAINDSFDLVQEMGPGSDRMFSRFEEDVQETKLCLAGEFGGEPSSFALTQSTTEGCNIVLWGLPWQEGDHLLLTDCEHPGVAAAAEQLARRLKLDLSYCPIAGLRDDRKIVESVSSSIRPNTKLVVVSHVLWNTGKVLPLPLITQVVHESGAQVLVDGAQSAGVLPLDLTVSPADYYSFTGHKWICGPDGVGALYVRPERVKELQPTFVGWRSVEWGGPDKLPKWTAGAGKFEVATSAFPLLAGLRAAIALHQSWGSSSQRCAAIIENSQSLRNKLAETDNVSCFEPVDSGLITFNVSNESPRYVAEALEKRRIIVRSIPRPKCVRASVHYMTNEEDMDALVDCLSSLKTSTGIST